MKNYLGEAGMNEEELKYFISKAEVPNKDLRRRIIEKGTEINSTHFASSFSCVDTIKYLYDKILTREDIFLLSKGHGELALYSVLESKGYKPEWKPHLDLNTLQGIHATTGSLGHGFPIGLGMAHSKKILNQKGKVYVLISDAEMETGSTYETLALGKKLDLDNIVLLIDWNKHQATGNVQDIGGINEETLSSRLSAFGWDNYCIKGHKEENLKFIQTIGNGLTAIILDTIKGNGLKCLENGVHGYTFSKEEYENAMEFLK